MNVACVYLISGDENFRALYVGQTHNSQRRWREHCDKLRRGTHGNPALQSAYNKYGPDEFHFIPVEFPPDNRLTEREQAWLDAIRNGGQKVINCGDCVNPQRLGVRHSDETRRKISQSKVGTRLSAEQRAQISVRMKGRRLSLESIKQGADARRGFRHTEESRKRMSESSKGKVASPETRLKISIAAKARVFTPEHRKNMSLARIGKKHSEATIQKLRVAAKARVCLQQEMRTGKVI